jgi:hypothetical protein
MKKNRCILIDVENKSITEIYLEEGLQPIYDALKCDYFESVMIDGTNDLYVDEEGLFKVEENTKFFQYGTGQYLVGNGLVTAHNDEGETIDTSLSVDYVKERVRFFNLNELQRSGLF